MSVTPQLPEPPVPVMMPFAAALRRVPGDIRPTALQREVYLRCTQVGDPPADAVVEMFRRLPAGVGRRMFDRAVEHGIEAVDDAPQELVAFFAEVEAVPYWVDRGLLDRAVGVIGRTGVIGDVALAMGSLMGGYLASRVVKTLVRTGDLRRAAPRRIAETTSWFAEVTAPGGLKRFAPGFQATVRVRLMHALVRAGMSRRADWDWQEWDCPVNQSAMAGTVMLFAIGNLAGSQVLGLHFSRRERDAVFHLWRYVGFLLGVRPDILPSTERDFWRLFWLQADYEFGHPDEDSIALAQALVQAIGPVIVGEGNGLLRRLGRQAATSVLCAYARLILDKPGADFLGLDDHTLLQRLLLGAAAVIRLLEYPRRLLPGATRLGEILGQRVRRASATQMMQRHHGDCRYNRHDRLTATTPPPEADRPGGPVRADHRPTSPISSAHVAPVGT